MSYLLCINIKAGESIHILSNIIVLRNNSLYHRSIISNKEILLQSGEMFLYNMIINDQGLLIVIVANKIALPENLIAWLSQDPARKRVAFFNLKSFCNFNRVAILSIVLISLIALGTINIYSLQKFKREYYLKYIKIP